MNELKNGKSKSLHIVLIILIIALVVLLCYSNLDVFLTFALSKGSFSYSKFADLRAFICIALMFVINILLIINKENKLSKGWCLAWFFCAICTVLSILASWKGHNIHETMYAANIYYIDYNLFIKTIYDCCEQIKNLSYFSPYLTLLPVFDLADHSMIFVPFQVSFQPTPWIETAAAKCLLTVLALSVFNFTSCWMFLPHPKLKKIFKKDKTSINKETI